MVVVIILDVVVVGILVSKVLTVVVLVPKGFRTFIFFLIITVLGFRVVVVSVSFPSKIDIKWCKSAFDRLALFSLVSSVGLTGFKAAINKAVEKVSFSAYCNPVFHSFRHTCQNNEARVGG